MPLNFTLSSMKFRVSDDNTFHKSCEEKKKNTKQNLQIFLGEEPKFRKYCFIATFLSEQKEPHKVSSNKSVLHP